MPTLMSWGRGSASPSAGRPEKRFGLTASSGHEIVPSFRRMKKPASTDPQVNDIAGFFWLRG
jgi:hypothetical protein